MKKTIYCYIVLILLLIFVSAISLLVGNADVDVWAVITGAESSEIDRVILFSIRLPRLLSSLVAGMGLSVAGVLLQNVMGNPLASPNTIGVNAGAGLAVIVALAFAPWLASFLPLAAFFGAFLTAMLIMMLSDRVRGGRSTVILAGIACTSFFQAGISFVSSLDNEVLASYNAFSLGSFVGVENSDLLLPALLVMCCFVVSIALSARISVLSLGDEIATSLGVNVRKMRCVVLLLAALSAASVISYAGLLGFVGLVVPHIAAKLVGTSVRRHLIASALCGAILVTLSDLVGRTLFSPSEISVGIVMSFVGAPFFFFLLLRRRKEYVEL